MAQMNPPNSDAVVDIADDLVERYEAAGWSTKKSTAKPAAKKSTAKK